jgi:hypothetical protein
LLFPTQPPKDFIRDPVQGQHGLRQTSSCNVPRHSPYDTSRLILDDDLSPRVRNRPAALKSISPHSSQYDRERPGACHRCGGSK